MTRLRRTLARLRGNALEIETRGRLRVVTMTGSAVAVPQPLTPAAIEALVASLPERADHLMAQEMPLAEIGSDDFFAGRLRSLRASIRAFFRNAVDFAR